MAIILTLVVSCVFRAVVGEVDEDLDAKIQFESLKAAPLKPIRQ